MILIEFIVATAKLIWYLIARFTVWILTARDCRHCYYGRCECYYSGNEWMCDLPDHREVRKCQDSITMVHFKRKNKEGINE